MNQSIFRGVLLSVMIAGALQSNAYADLTFDEAIELAVNNDNWQADSQLKEQAVRERAFASAALPDPMVRLAVANLPTDTFDLDQEAMTQLQVGVSQMIPRGDTLALKKKRFNLLADASPLQRAEREAQVQRTVGRLWLNIFSREVQIRMIEDNRHLFQQLVDVATASYRLGGSRSHDLVRAELELTRLDDRVVRLQQERDRFYGDLSRWLPADQAMQPLATTSPVLNSLMPLGSEISKHQEQQLLRHPKILLIDQQLKVARQDIHLSEQAYKPQFNLNANYGYRMDAPNGNERANLFSFGVSFDLPLFPEEKQDPMRRASQKQHDALRETRLLALRQLRGDLYREHASWSQLVDREKLFDERLLRQMRNQTEAAVQAYAADTSDFAEVMRAAIAELDAQLERIRLKTARQQSILNINYILSDADQLAESTP